MMRLPPAVRLVGIGWYFAVCIVGGIVGGLLLDRLAGTTPILTLVGLFLGLLAASVGGYRMLMETLQDVGRSTGKRREP